MAGCVALEGGPGLWIDHRVRQHSTNPLEQLSGEIKRRTKPVRILAIETTIHRLVGAILAAQNDEPAV